MKEEVWADRVKIRKMMKAEMSKYDVFFKTHFAGVKEWLLALSPTLKKRMFQLARSEVSEMVTNTYDIRGAYMVVFCAVVEQVQNFPKTEYKKDGRGVEEEAFEQFLTFDRRMGFSLREDGEEADEALKAFIDFLPLLGGPKLMPRRQKEERKEGDESGDEGGENGEEDEVVGIRGQSFRADRRLARLVISRYWADRVIDQYTNTVLVNEEDYGEEAEEKEEVLTTHLKLDLKLDGLDGLKNLGLGEAKLAA